MSKEIRNSIFNLPEGGSSGSSWTPQNFLTTNSAADNVTALNDALTNHRSVYISTPGVYEINDTIWIPSNTKLEFVAGCSIKKATGSDFTFVFANKGILTYSTDNNIALFGNGLNIIVNNIDRGTQGMPYRLRGQCSFLRVNGLVLDGIVCTDNLTFQAIMHFAGLDGFLITNMICKGGKDALRFNTSKNGVIQNLLSDTYDDSLEFQVSDYASCIALVGGFDNIKVINWRSENVINPPGGRCMILLGSWKVWETGVTYYSGDLCVNNGRIYVKSNVNGIVSANAPVHVVGKVTGGDGIEWDWVQDGTITEGIINNITFQDCSVIDAPNCFRFTNENDLINHRCTFPGTEGNSYIDNLVIDNFIWVPPLNGGFINNESYIKKITIKNSDIDISTASLTSGGFIYSSCPAGYGFGIIVEELIIDNCNIQLPTDGSICFVYETTTSVISKIDIINSVIDCNGAPLLQSSGNQDITITNTELINLNSIISSPLARNVSITVTDCIFTDPVMVVYYDRPTGAATFIADGCTYTNPSGSYLFHVEWPNVLTINVINSNGDISQRKIADAQVIIVNCDLYDHFPLYSIGDSAFGGRVLFVNTDRFSGIIVGDNDLSNAIWGCSGVDISGTQGIVGRGQADSNLILAGCATAGIAARLCDEYNDGVYSDWYLPANNEMSLCYTYRAVLGSFQNASYQTSRNINATTSYVVNPITGVAVTVDKTTARPVRPFRNFIVAD